MNKKNTPKKKPLVSAMPQVWALEARLMFDAAAASDVAAAVSAPAVVEAAPVVHAAEAPVDDAARNTGVEAIAPAPAVVEQARVEALGQVHSYLQQADAAQRLFEQFGGDRTTADASWTQAVAQLQTGLQQGTWGVDIQLLSSSTLKGGFGAFAASGPSGKPVIFLNADWIAAGPDVGSISRVLIEEIGHAIDVQLNGTSDTAGDEGEAFAAKVLGLDGDWARIAVEDDSSTITIDGREVAIEEASVTFSQVWKVTPTSLSEETNSFTTDPTALNGTKFRFTSGVPGDPYFSGNNVSGTLSYVDGGGVSRSISGVVSRLVKTGSVIDGFYFYVQGTDGDIGTSDDTAYLFKSGTAFVYSGNTSYGTSSDPVDRALNALIVSNSAPVASNDSGTVVEEGATSGNLLTNDTDANQDALRVTGFTVNGVTTAVAAGTSGNYTIAGVGTLVVGSSGAYTFTPVSNYAGAVPQVTYTLTDGTATSSATLALTVTAVNDAPSGASRAVSISESAHWTFSAADFGFTDVADTPANSLQSVVLAAVPASGTLRLNGVAVTAGQEIQAVDLTRLVFTPTANGPSTASFTFQVRDNGGTANGGVNLDPTARTFSFNISNANEAPVAVADVAPAAAEAGGSSNGTPGVDPTGNVLTNDTDADAGDTRAVTVVRSTVTGNSAAPALNSTSTSNAALVVGTYGTLHIGADGSYKYVVNNSNTSVQALRVTGQSLSESFSYTIKDAANASAGATLSITITGANDTPTAVIDQAYAKESTVGSGNYTSTDTTGSLGTGNVLTNDTDADTAENGETKRVVGLLATATGVTPGASITTLIMSDVTGVQANDYLFTNPTGTKTALLNSAGVQVRVVSFDAVNKTVTLNDAAIMSSLTNGTLLGFTNNSNGNGSFVSKTFVSSTNAANASTSVTISTNDGAIAQGMSVSGTGIGTGVTVTSVTYSGTTITGIVLSQSVQLASNSALTFSASAGTTVFGRYGTLAIASIGEYTYTPFANNAALSDVLPPGTESFRYQMQDAAGASSTSRLNITVTGSGVNDPNATDDAAMAIEAGGFANATPGIDPTFQVLVNDTTPSGSGPSTVTAVRSASGLSETAVASGSNQAVTGLYGTLTLSSAGTASYAVNNTDTTVQGLRGSGNTLTDIFYYRVRNTLGREDIASITVTVRGSNDTPVAVADLAVAQAAGGTTTGMTAAGNLLSNDTDLDTGDTKTVTKANAGVAAPVTAVAAGTTVAGSYGILTISSDGSYSYAVNAANASVRALVAGATLNDVFSYEVRDTAGLVSTTTLTLTVTGANDAPANTAPATHAQFDYQTSRTISGVSVNDVDGDLSSVTVSVGSGTLAVSGTLTGVTGNGTNAVTIAGNQTSINALLATLAYSPNVGFSGTDTLRLASTDAVALTDLDTIEITVAPDNRALTVTSPTVNEGSPYAVFSVTGVAGQRVSLELGTTGSTTGHATAGLDFGSAIEVWNGTSWIAYTGGLTTLDGSGTLLVRTTVAQDIAYEGAETMRLLARNAADTASASGGTAGTGTIVDDGAGLKFTGGVNAGSAVTSTAALDDDRAITIASIDVNEGAGYAVFTVNGAAGQVVTLTLRDGTAGTADHGSTLEVYDTATSNWVAYGGSLTLPAGGSAQVRTTVANDALFEGSEGFALVAANGGGGEFLGIARILDDGTGVGGTDDDTPTLAVSSPTVTEGGNAEFTISLSKASVFPVSFTPTVMSGTATLGTDSAAVSSLQYFNGTAWVNVSGPITMAAGSTAVQVRLATSTDSLYEGNESFTLSTGVVSAGTVSNLSGASGTATIADATAAPVFSITDSSVAEGGTMTFTVSRSGNAQGVQTVNYTSAHGTAGASDYTGVTGTLAFAEGETSKTFTVATATDAIVEGTEAFSITLTTPTGGATISSSAGTASGSIVDAAASAVTVSSPTVNEGSATAVFTVTGTAGQRVSLVLGGGTATGGGTDYGASAASRLQVSSDAGASWVDYSAAVTLPAGGVVLVRTPLAEDSVSDNNETFTLTATPAGGMAAVGTATIKDDGSGTVYGASGAADASAVASDDRALTVSSPTVNEGSPFAVFAVSGGANQLVRLDLQAGIADRDDYGGPGSGQPLVEVYGASGWTSYVPGSAVPLDAAGRILVRTTITSDSLNEGDHDFQLRVTTTGNVSYTGTATINDRGAGVIYLGSNTSGAPSLTTDAGYPRLDDDRPPPSLAPGPLAPIKVAEPVALEMPAFPLVAPQRFDSILETRTAATSGEIRKSYELYSEGDRLLSAALDLREIDDIYTRAGGFRTVVIKATEPDLRLFRGVEDQIVPVQRTLHLQVPADAFLHTDAGQTVLLAATLMDGTALPTWLRFNDKSGTFDGQPPQDQPLDLRIKVTARDTFGREATAIFRLKSETQRGGLTSQLHRGEAFGAAGRGFQLQRARR